MIGSCDNCNRQNVPVHHFAETYCGETTQCFLCQGDTDPDPYSELLDAAEIEIERAERVR